MRSWPFVRKQTEFDQYEALVRFDSYFHRHMSVENDSYGNIWHLTAIFYEFPHHF